eukprot:3136153-Pyramimonas_sp.AAC.1
MPIHNSSRTSSILSSPSPARRCARHRRPRPMIGVRDVGLINAPQQRVAQAGPSPIPIVLFVDIIVWNR